MSRGRRTKTISRQQILCPHLVASMNKAGLFFFIFLNLFAFLQLLFQPLMSAPIGFMIGARQPRRLNLWSSCCRIQHGQELKITVVLMFQITALCVIPMTWQYWVLVVGLITGGGLIFFILAKLGERLLAREEMKQMSMSSTTPLAGFDNKIRIADEPWKIGLKYSCSNCL